MGGSCGGGEAIAEFNARCDPEAAAIVLNAGWPVRLLGLEITRQVHFSRAEFASIPETDPAARLLKQQAPGWIERVEAQGWEQDGCSLHDAVAVAALLDESLFSFLPAEITVELHDPARRGVTRCRPEAGSLIRVATEVDAARCHELIWRHITAG